MCLVCLISDPHVKVCGSKADVMKAKCHILETFDVKVGLNDCVLLSKYSPYRSTAFILANLAQCKNVCLCTRDELRSKNERQSSVYRYIF